jgi:hypothetical protein
LKKEAKMKKRKLTRLEAFQAVKSLKESKKAIKFVKLEDVGEAEVFAVVTPSAGGAEVKFQDGDMLVGPFASEEEAQEQLGTDVQLVVGDEGGAAVTEVEYEEMPENEEMETKMKTEMKKPQSNMLRLRKQVVESIHAKVKADILRESEALDVETDVKSGEASTDAAAGATDLSKTAASVNAEDLGSNDNKVDADQSADAKNSDANLLENAPQAGQLVNIIDRKTNSKVDTGIVESVKGKEVKLESSDAYSVIDYKVQILA